MLKVFISSTSRDLRSIRGSLLTELDNVLKSVGMEKFAPDGTLSQLMSVNKLMECDIVIFLISPHYGSLIDKCIIPDCRVEDCPMKDGRKISYTHCEFKVALAYKKPHMTYVIDFNWKALEFLSNNKVLQMNVTNFKNEEAFYGMDDDVINHYMDKLEYLLEFSKDFSNESFYEIHVINQTKVVDLIRNHLAKNIGKWHKEKKISLIDFCDRHDELFDLLEKMEDKVELIGVGGIGKTSLIQIALLINKLKGRKIIAIGPRQSYNTGSGYNIFKKKCKEFIYDDISGINITISDVVESLQHFIPNIDEIRKKSNIEKLKVASKVIENNKIIYFIDDFHFASEEIIELAKHTNNIIISSRKDLNIPQLQRIVLSGIPKKDLDSLINIYSNKFQIKLTDSMRQTIKNFSEGHPVSTALLVFNCDKIDFTELQSFKDSIDFLNPDDILDYLSRLIEEIFKSNKEALTLLKDLAVINSDLDKNIDRSILKQVYKGKNFVTLFNQLIDSGMLKVKDRTDVGKQFYEFSFFHIQNILVDDKNSLSHERAIEYYTYKKEKYGTNVNDNIELFYHQIKGNIENIDLSKYLDSYDNASPTDYGFWRLIQIGEILRENLRLNDKSQILGTLGLIYKSIDKYKEAEVCFLEAIEADEELSEFSDLFLINLERSYSNLGILYSNLMRLSDAEIYYLKALDVLKKLAKKNPMEHLIGFAKTKSNLAILYQSTMKYNEAEKLFFESYKIFKDLVEKNPNTNNLFNLIHIQNSIGANYWEMNNFEKAQKYYQDSLNLLKSINDKNHKEYLPQFASTHNRLGALYASNNFYEKAQSFFENALKTYKELASYNPDAFLSDLGTTLMNIGNVKKNLGHNKEAELSYLESLKIFKNLVKDNPMVYLEDLAAIHYNMARFYKKIGNVNKTETQYFKSLKYYKKLAKINKKSFLAKVAEVESNLGLISYTKNSIKKAQKFYSDSLQNYRKLKKFNQELYDFEIAEIQINLGSTYRILKSFKESEAMYLKSLKTLKLFVEKNPGKYLETLGILRNNMGRLYFDLRRYSEAEDAYGKAIVIFSVLNHDNPGRYSQNLMTIRYYLQKIYKTTGKI